jgi:hypothetical protein
MKRAAQHVISYALLFSSALLIGVTYAQSPGGGRATPDSDDGDQNRYQYVGSSESAGIKKIEQALHGRLHEDIVFTETPLDKVAKTLQDKYKIPIQFDALALDAVGVRPNEPVTISLRDVSLKSALRLILKNLQLTYVLQDEVLTITTPDEAGKRVQIGVYDVRDLVDEPNGRPLSALVEVLDATIGESNECSDCQSQTTIRALKPGTLIVSANQARHEELQDLLEAIRAMNREQPTTSTHFPKAPIPATESKAGK